jgi:1,5-anhydro-D-fructose reductase (1,5-anhydro-D-mannitol-forming)
VSSRAPRTIRWGIIGCGEVAEVKSGPAFQKATHSTLVAVMRRDAARAEDFARRHGVPRWHTDADAILEAPDIDAVYIATLPDTHRDYAERAAAAGKAVYVEKPMAMNAAECDAMIAACATAGVPLWVGYYRRALPRFLAVRDLLREGAIGEVREVVSTQTERAPDPRAPGAWRRDAARAGGGPFFEGVVHTLDLLDFLYGPMEVVASTARARGEDCRLEDLVEARYRFASGVIGRGRWDFAAHADCEVNEIVGTRGRLRFSTTRDVPIECWRSDGREVIPLADPPHVHQPLIQTIVDEFNGLGHCPSTGESAARTARVVDRILAPLRR